MAIIIANQLYFRISGVGSNLYTLHCFWCWATLSNTSGNPYMKGTTQFSRKTVEHWTTGMANIFIVISQQSRWHTRPNAVHRCWRTIAER